MADVPARSDSTSGPSIRWIRWLVVINLVLVALQPISAGLFLSGFGRALPAHAAVGLALQLGLLVQVGTAVVQWRRRRIPAWVAAVSTALFVAVVLQNVVGHNKLFWLHVPMGVALVGALNGQRSSLSACR